MNTPKTAAPVKLMPPELRAKLPPIGSTSEDSDPKVWVKYFSPYSGALWLITEFDGHDEMFGWAEVHPGMGELGYIYLSELMRMKRGPLPLVERDLYFKPKPLSQAKVQERRMAAAGRVTVLSPDGIPIRPVAFRSEAEAQSYIKNWVRRYLGQGYYSTAHGEKIPVKDLESRLTRQASEDSLPIERVARFAEGDTAGWEAWMKTQPQSVQDDWAANKEKYGDKFKTASEDTLPIERQARFADSPQPAGGIEPVKNASELPLTGKQKEALNFLKVEGPKRKGDSGEVSVDISSSGFSRSIWIALENRGLVDLRVRRSGTYAALPLQRQARFAEGDTAGWEAWMKTQPQSVQDDWAANKEKYGDKFKTASVSPQSPSGTRVVVKANPVSRRLYTNLPPNGAAGTVRPVAMPGGKTTYMKGPGGGLLYVQFDEYPFMGVSPNDLVAASLWKSVPEDIEVSPLGPDLLPIERQARFAEGDTAGWEAWMKTQPQSVQDDWAANKEKYGDKFKTAGWGPPSDLSSSMGARLGEPEFDQDDIFIEDEEAPVPTPKHPKAQRIERLIPDVRWHAGYSGRGMSGKISPLAFATSTRPNSMIGRKLLTSGFAWDQLGRDFIYYLYPNPGRVASVRSASEVIGEGSNVYVCFWRGKRVEVNAETTYEAQELAAKYFGARKSYEISTILAEKGGQQVTHLPMFASQDLDMLPIERAGK